MTRDFLTRKIAPLTLGIMMALLSGCQGYSNTPDFNPPAAVPAGTASSDGGNSSSDTTSTPSDTPSDPPEHVFKTSNYVGLGQ